MSGYIGPIPVPQGIQNKETFTATAGQTTFNTNGYTDGAFISVYLNGVRLINGTDYTATNGSDFVLTQAASVSDVVDFESFNSFSLVDQTFNNVTLKNPTHEDTDGGRESTLIFKGEQSGGEISTLAEIEAAHDGTADDQKGDLIFRTNDGSDGTSPTEVLRTNSAGNLLITSSDQNGLTLNTTDSNGGFIALKTSGTAKGYIGTSHHLVSGGSPSEDDITIRAEGKLQFAIGATEELRLDSDGLKFNGDTAAANALDDYEEGTWTPIDTSGGSLSLSAANGYYVKIGSSVWVWYQIQYPSTGDTNNTKITGLPFSAAINSTYSGSISITNYGYSDILGMFEPSEGGFRFRNYSNAGLTNANLSTAFVYGTAFYRTA